MGQFDNLQTKLPVVGVPVQFKGMYTQPLTEPNGPLQPSASVTTPLTTAAVYAAQRAAFKLLSIPKLGKTRDSKQFTRRFEDPNAYNPDEPDGFSAMGTPIYGRIILGDTDPNKDNSYTDALGRQGSYVTVELDCAIVSVEFNNKVVVTNITGAPTSIKEWISNSDNDITITGIFNSTPGVAPYDFIINMNKIFRTNVPIPVTNQYLNSLDIFYIVIMPGTTMGQTEGGYASQAFTIKAISDVPMTELLP